VVFIDTVSSCFVTVLTVLSAPIIVKKRKQTELIISSQTESKSTYSYLKRMWRAHAALPRGSVLIACVVSMELPLSRPAPPEALHHEM
jgi:hypothetical protein